MKKKIIPQLPQTGSKSPPVPNGLKNDDLACWYIGQFMYHFSSLETAVTLLIITILNCTNEPLAQIAFRGSNMGLKVSTLIQFKKREAPAYFKESVDAEQIRKFSEKRNLLAHGCISFEANEIHISMPERDGMFKTDKNGKNGIKIYRFSQMDEFISKMAKLTNELKKVREKWINEVHGVPFP